MANKNSLNEVDERNNTSKEIVEEDTVKVVEKTNLDEVDDTETEPEENE